MVFWIRLPSPIPMGTFPSAKSDCLRLSDS